ncbi:MAG: SPFH/Band 7/PHB domain protein [Candidatus Thermoplasmatota archaeon]|nr:SPFH/Band 7/PHB domain protein [Euryarchaeota archaeon]MBU4032013.1 SPFH/Band 7/PHB domain protein [Candidatus Thermoplasmatota archaeon]MBU4071791.1 SPFH/Band 7/PHB domain protein [Candidatus Thermoplasmatota archaeon]MBU4143898.1 SPFH/Band 7/PHB domain protein [Candidatus Thermoplasmatota archaeon]MBU4592493.1 SPFH/Band 7/PHB domain protein [Candidatus Thermoplasmatota archaeon]
MSIEMIIGLVLLIIFAVIFILMTSVRIVQPYEQGLLVVLGNFKRVLNPGFNMVPPLISQVTKLDLRTQVMDVPRQEVITKDNSPTNVDAIIYIKVIDPKKAYFEVDDYRRATIYLGQTTLRSIIGNMELDEILYSRERINDALRDILDKATDQWGVKVEAVEIREVDPTGPVKAAMVEQTSSERRRRAAILTADGEKRSSILVAEGNKRSRILQAEGVRQSKILEAEGQRMAMILEGQGEAQRLRILAMGALPLDHKAMTVLSLEALKKMADGQATKIIFPFEISRLVEGAADYLGVSRKEKDYTAMSMTELEGIVGKASDILGDIPNNLAIREKIQSIEKELAQEAQTTEKIAENLKKGTKQRFDEIVGN